MRVTGRRLTAAVVTLIILSAVGYAAIGAASSSQESPTFVESDITADTTWSPSDGPYRVVTSITVAKDATLTIDPGTVIEFVGRTDFGLQGDVQAIGTESNPIITRWVGDGGAYEFTGGNDNQLQFTHVQFKGPFAGFSLGSAQEVSFHDVTMSRGGLRFNSGVPTVSITDSTFNFTSGGDYSTRFGVKISAGGVSDVTIQGNNFRGASKSAIDIRTSDKNSPMRNITIGGNTIRESDENGIILTTTTDTGFSNFRAPMKNVRIVSNQVWRNDKHGIFLRAKPKQDLTSVTASISATEVVGNNVQNNGKTGIALRSSSTASPESTVARNVVLNHSTGIAIERVRTTVTKNAIGHNDRGLFIKRTDANVLNVTANNIYQNNVGLEPFSSAAIANATNNYWGDKSGPEHPALPDGEGNSVEAGAGAVEFLPFADSPIENVPQPEPRTQSTNGGDGDDDRDNNDGNSDDDGDNNDGNSDNDGNNDSSDNDGFGPGFGPGVVLAGLSGVGYLLKRRGDTGDTDAE